MEIKIDNKIFFGIGAAAAVGIILFASGIGGGLFGRASSAEIEQGKNNCVRWIPREFDYVRYNTRGEFERQQGDELIYTVWGAESSYASRASGITCVFNIRTGAVFKPSALDQNYR